mmetsp:Transcript_92956/g.284528  ORF Transcript_92956/g.284528 Transcript_92956/m.284528 type:complete len:223 (-) Transcript_92956:150-818(-)
MSDLAPHRCGVPELLRHDLLDRRHVLLQLAKGRLAPLLQILDGSIQVELLGQTRLQPKNELGLVQFHLLEVEHVAEELAGLPRVGLDANDLSLRELDPRCLHSLKQLLAAGGAVVLPVGGRQAKSSAFQAGALVYQVGRHPVQQEPAIPPDDLLHGVPCELCETCAACDERAVRLRRVRHCNGKVEIVHFLDREHVDQALQLGPQPCVPLKGPVGRLLPHHG